MVRKGLKLIIRRFLVVGRKKLPGELLLNLLQPKTYALPRRHLMSQNV